MKERDLSPDTYLDQNFDYKKLTKTELKKILFENNVNVKSNALKQELLENYKDNIYDKIEILKENKKKELQKMENIFQSRSSIQEIDLNNNSLLNTERVLRRTSSQGRAISNNSSFIEDDEIAISKPNTKKKNSSFVSTPSKKPVSLNERLEYIKNKSYIEESSEEEINNTDISKEISEIKQSMFSNVEKKKKTPINIEKTPIKNDKTPIKNEKTPIKNEKLNTPIKNEKTPIKNEKTPIKNEKTPIKNETPSRNINISPVKERANTQRLKNLIEEDLKKMQKEPEFFTPRTVRRDKEVEKKPVMSNKEQLRQIIEEDMRKHPSRKLNNSSMFEDSSFSNYTGTSFPNLTQEGINQDVITPKGIKQKWIVFPVFIILILGIILKSLPYDNGKCFFCVKIPSNGKLVNGKLVCNKGFIYKTSLFRNSCILDDSKEKIKNKTIKEIIKKLMFKHGDFKYGRSKTQYMKIQDLTDNEEIINALRNNSLVSFKGEFISSKEYKVSLRTFMHFYARKILFIIFPFTLLILIIKYYQIKRRTRRENEIESKKITKDVLNVLLRQLIVATSNSRFPEYVYKDQLKDVFGENKEVWKIVEKKVGNNSNVSTLKMEDKVAWQWIGPVMRRKESIDNIL